MSIHVCRSISSKTFEQRFYTVEKNGALKRITENKYDSIVKSVVFESHTLSIKSVLTKTGVQYYTKSTQTEQVT